MGKHIRWLGAVVIGLGLVMLGVIGVYRMISTDETLAGVLYQAADFDGIHPFLAVAPAAAVGRPVAGAPVTPVRSGGKTAGGIQVSGGEPGVYGGLRDQPTGGVDALVAFFADHVDERRAVVRTLTGDPGVERGGGSGLSDADLGGYLRGLTPVVLRLDIRVTDHEYREGKVTPFETVLQRGTSVLVDAHGVPRMRDRSGSPLTISTSVGYKAVYSGRFWAGFDAAAVLVVTGTPDALTDFTLFDIASGAAFDRPAGTNGTDDRPPATTVRAGGR
ncbi:DUF6777 domain-containing protein [Nocardia inohanensis]|uniref:DUF6777 domain-containing protein n=1 Tax=Nocardia inohanensis TaxID=209246 RepID=UPI000AB39092|nr:DUF6777 domain-containing protein [Nocardia inohanensis]